MDRPTYISIRNSLDLEKKPMAPAIHALQDIALIAATVGLWTFFQDSWLRFLMIPLVFCLMFRGFAIMHDAVHGAVSKTRWVNDIAGFLGGAFCFLPYENWKRSHLKHHFWSGNVEKDPVMALIIAYPKLSKLSQSLISYLWMLWFPVLSLAQQVLFWSLSIGLYVKEPKSFKMLFSIVLPILFWGLLFFATPVAFATTILLPALFLYNVGVEVVNFPHHLQLPMYRGEHKFPVWEQFQTARSCVYPKWFARSVVLNFNYHIEHHMFPDVAWYHLDKLHVPVKAALGVSYNSDPRFSWIMTNKKENMGHVLELVEPPSNPAQVPVA